MYQINVIKTPHVVHTWASQKFRAINGSSTKPMNDSPSNFDKRWASKLKFGNRKGSRRRLAAHSQRRSWLLSSLCFVLLAGLSVSWVTTGFDVPLAQIAKSCAVGAHNVDSYIWYIHKVDMSRKIEKYRWCKCRLAVKRLAMYWNSASNLTLSCQYISTTS